MRSFVIREVRILSRREKSAVSVKFNHVVTVIKGENDTGKSSLMKTIYWTLGCEPAKTSDEWRALDICAAVTIELDGALLTFVRHNRCVGLFDERGNLMRVFQSVSGDLAPYIAEKFMFGLVLNNRGTGEPEVPPPSFYLLPYYLDQDASWSSPWTAFSRLGQYSAWQNDVAEYHVGLRDSEYYRLKAELRSLAADRVEPEREERALGRAVEQVKQRLGLVQVDIDLERFQQEISELVVHADRLAAEQEKYRNRLGELIERRSFATSQLGMARAVLSDLSKDYTFALRQADRVDCPTCGATYHNSIVERFDLAVDQHRCEDLVVELNGEISTINKDMGKAERELAACRRIGEQISDVLATKRGMITLRQVIQSEARGEAVEALERQLGEVREILGRLRVGEQEASSALKVLESKGRRRAFLADLSNLVAKHSVALNVPAPSRVKRFSYPIMETGSDAPRAILAYHFAILAMAWRRGDVIHAPLCIDSPNQQDQDPANYAAMLEFIRDRRNQQQQLILALVDTAGVKFPGDALVLSEKRKLLDPSVFETVGAEVHEMVARMYSAAAG